MVLSGFQGLVNGWIRVNSKHVVIQNTTSTTRDESGANANTVRRRSSFRGDDDSNEQSSSKKSNDRETSAIKKYGARRKNRQLERTVSLTDLLREMAQEKEAEHQFIKESMQNSTTAGSESSEKHAPQPAAARKASATPSVLSSAPNTTRDDQSDSSFRFVAGFFGGDIPLLPLPPPPPPILNDSKPPAVYYPRKAAEPVLTKQQRQSPRGTHRRNGSNGASVGSASRSAIMMRTDSMPSSKGEDSHFNPAAVTASLRSTPPLHPTTIQSDDSRSKSQNPMQSFFKNFPNSGRCGSCQEYENRLIAMSTDMEYLRSMALRNEYVCRECQNEELSLQTKDSILRLTDASTRLAEIETQHFQDIEALTQQRSLWQQDMQHKLSKFATIAKDLNEQSALRSQEAIKLEEELVGVKAERDSLAFEVLKLRAAAAHHDAEQIDHQMLKQVVTKYEVEGLQQARKIVEDRDGVIRDLTSKLERAVDIIDMERRKLRQQRRQIIFPPRNSNPSLSVALEDSTTVNELDAKEQAHAAEMKVEKVQAEAARAEAAFIMRIRELETRLLAAES